MDDVNLKQKLASNLRREMDARGLTTSELARRCGWKQPRISELLRADHSPTLDTVEALERALAVPAGSLLLPPPEISSAALLTG
jgi:transcriptional regulator with XRE-family HTH domain